jgi:hypothetical protein
VQTPRRSRDNCVDRSRPLSKFRRWCVPELLRVRALGLAAREKTDEAIDLLVEGLAIARSQDALAWELRLASTLVGTDDKDSARDRLREVLNRTSEGFGTRDYRDAVARLGQIADNQTAPRALTP